jgi:hypothetical protein
VTSFHSAGGRDHPEGTARWSHLATDGATVAVLAESWEAPDKGALRLLCELRQALGPRRRLVVLLGEMGEQRIAPPAPGDLRNWREGLARLEDPWLAVEPIGEPP